MAEPRSLSARGQWEETRQEDPEAGSEPGTEGTRRLPEGRGSPQQLPYTLGLGGPGLHNGYFGSHQARPWEWDPPSLPSVFDAYLRSTPPTWSLARRCTYDDRQAQGVPADVTHRTHAIWRPHPPPNVTRHRQMSPESGEQNCLWPGGHRTRQHRSSRAERQCNEPP